MKLLIDTHALLWWVLKDRRLPERMRDLFSHEETIIVISAVSGWEIATKHRLGKPAVPLALAQSLAKAVRENGWQTLSLTIEHGHWLAAWLAPIKDPSTGCWRLRRSSRICRSSRMIQRSRASMFGRFGKLA